MTDPSVFLLLHQIIINAMFLIQIIINIHLAYIVEQIEIKVFYLAFLQLFLENLLHLIHIRKVISRELAGQVKFLSRVLFQRTAHYQL